jgi:hypothetical protein
LHNRGFRLRTILAVSTLLLLAAPVANAAATELTVDGKGCDSFTPTATPTFRARADAPDVRFEWTKVLDDGTYDPAIQSQDVHNHPDGTITQVTATDLPEGRHAFRVTDGAEAPTSWCGFTIDLVAPAAPTVTAGIYRPTGCPGVGCGGEGVADTFTFAGSSPDVVGYRWGFTDPPSTVVMAESLGASASVVWAPTQGGSHLLYVEAFDRAGLWARTTQFFYVASPTPRQGHWIADYDPAADVAGGGHDLELVGVDTNRPGRLRGGLPTVGFDGTTATTATTGKVLDTASGFTVMAWVRLTGDQADRTVISQQGTQTSAFHLGYQAAQRRWTFGVAEADTVNPAHAAVRSDKTAAVGVWTHLTGTYDQATGSVKLYVDGKLQRTTATPRTTFDAEGQLWLGRRLVNGTVAAPWAGDLYDAAVWKRAITAKEIAQLTDPLETAQVGDWKFNEASGRTAHDDSPWAHDLTVTSTGTEWVSGRDGGALRFDGTGVANAAEPVLDIDQSFTVDVWASLAETGTARTIVVQRGQSGNDPFVLRYNGHRWSADMTKSPTTSAAWRATSTADAVPNTWTRLTAVYDATAKTLSLRVDGAPQQTVSRVRGWNSDGVLSVGGGSTDAGWSGDVDELATYQAVVPVP